MAIRDWFFWKKRAAHDPCHGKPGGNPTGRAAAATMAVTIPLMSIFDGPPPPCNPLAQKFNAAWKRVMEDGSAAEKILRQDQKIDPGYRPNPK